MRSISLLLLLLLVTVIDFKIYSQRYTTQSTVSCGGVSTPVSAILHQRIPNDNFSHIPSTCGNEINAKKEQFREADLRNIDRIVNEFCSHKNGWTEYEPGTCQAGGPPPICPMDHWFRDFSKAQAQWAAKQRQLLTQRTVQIKAVACSCYGKVLSQQFTERNIELLRAVSSKATLENQAQEMRLPCLQIAGSSPCPPQYECRDGFCVLKSETQKALERVKTIGALAWEYLLKDRVLEKIIEYHSSDLRRMYKVFSSPYTKLFEPSKISTSIDGYTISSNKLISNYDTYYKLLLELNRYYTNQVPSRDKGYIIADLNKLKNEMNNNFILLNQHYNGIRVQKELFSCDQCCDNAFEVYHEQMGQYYTIFASLTFQ